MRKLVAFVLFATVAAALTGCGGGESSGSARPQPSPAAPPSSDRAPIGTSSAASDLAGRAAAAKGRTYSASYELTRSKKDEPVSVEVEMSADDKWSVEIPGGAQGGKTDVIIARERDTIVQCFDVKHDTCAPIATKADKIPAKIDPVVQHVFTDWLDVMLDRSTPVSVAHAKKIKGAQGECFWLERNSVTVSAPIPNGVYCLRADGIITAVKSEFGLLRLDGEPSEAPAKFTLPEDVDDDATPLSTTAPPKPSPSKSKKKK